MKKYKFFLIDLTIIFPSHKIQQFPSKISKINFRFPHFSPSLKSIRMSILLHLMPLFSFQVILDLVQQPIGRKRRLLKLQHQRIYLLLLLRFLLDVRKQVLYYLRLVYLVSRLTRFHSENFKGIYY